MDSMSSANRLYFYYNHRRRSASRASFGGSRFDHSHDVEWEGQRRNVRCFFCQWLWNSSTKWVWLVLHIAHSHNINSPQHIGIDLVVASEADDFAAHRLEQRIPVISRNGVKREMESFFFVEFSQSSILRYLMLCVVDLATDKGNARAQYFFLYYRLSSLAHFRSLVFLLLAVVDDFHFLSCVCCLLFYQ